MGPDVAELESGKRDAPARRRGQAAYQRAYRSRLRERAIRARTRHLDTAFTHLPLIWSPQIVYRRLKELAQVGERFESRISRTELEAMATHCGIIRPKGWQIWQRHYPNGAQMRPRPLTVCPTCAREAWWLTAEGGEWKCTRCTKWALTRTENLLGEFACAIRIGATGASIERRRQRLLRRLSLLAAKARTPKDLWLLAIGAPLVKQRLVRNRHGIHAVRRLAKLSRPAPGVGPILRRLRPWVLEAHIEELLHPNAYMGRFGAASRRV